MCMSWLQVCTYAVYLSPSQHAATSMAPTVLPGCCFIHLSPTEAKRRYALQQTKRSINKHLTLDSGHDSPRPSTQWVFQRLRIICRVTLRATPSSTRLWLFPPWSSFIPDILAFAVVDDDLWSVPGAKRMTLTEQVVVIHQSSPEIHVVSLVFLHILQKKKQQPQQWGRSGK